MATSESNLGTEVKQSLSLIAITAVTLLTSLVIGLLAGHVA